jgi:hypothetical protein
VAVNEYAFRTDWRVPARIEEVSAILEDVESLSDWWPSVYLEVAVLEPGGEKGVGKRVSLFTKGWLPYTLRWQFVVTEGNAPHGFSIAAEGDFVGTGVWTLTQRGADTEVRFDWTIRADKPLLRALSFALKPLFEANHKWAMARGEESLVLELRRRCGESGVPAPPAPTWPHAKGGRRSESKRIPG